MNVDDAALFCKQLNQLLQTTDKALWAESVCHLFRSFTKAGLRLTGADGEIVAEALAEDDGGAALSLPILRGDKQIGMLNVNGAAFTGHDRLAAGFIQALFTVLLIEINEKKQAERARRLESVRGAINSLSFSELEAAAEIVRRLPEGEGLLVSARLADDIKITRSVVVNALRKLEGAGMVEARSLGMKGTYIRIREALLSTELMKL
jgi:transcriptional pleiotropic repressor